MKFVSQITKNLSEKTDNFVSAHQRNYQFLTMDLLKLLNAFSPHVIKRSFLIK